MTGYDDLGWPQEKPFLTTFREPAYEMGQAAVDMVIDRLRNGWRPPERREFDAPLILRRSVSLCREAAGEALNPGHEVTLNVGQVKRRAAAAEASAGQL